MSGPAPPPQDDGAGRGERTERRWALVGIGVLAVFVVVATIAGAQHAALPQARVETVDPRTLHLRGEFIESNLGSAMAADGSVVVRAVAQQYSFTPPCILVPVDTLVTIRATSADAVHGFLIEGTNVNLMLVPGYVSSLSTRFTAPGERHMPCHEFCGVGHEGMWGRVRIVDKAQFARLAADRRRLDCVE
jgi:cytochrome c oxidase subunit 2